MCLIFSDGFIKSHLDNTTLSEFWLTLILVLASSSIINHNCANQRRSSEYAVYFYVVYVVSCSKVERSDITRKHLFCQCNFK